MKRTDKHIFVVCAYGASPYLDACVQSLVDQTLRSRILICTSTPNDTITAVCEKYGLELRVNHGERGITGDWNFAMSQADAPFVTIAHQDDLYEPTYTEAVMGRAMRAKRPILIFSEYYEIRNGTRVTKNRLLSIKKLMNCGFRIASGSRWMRRRVLSIGNSICCPAVTYSREALGDFRFDAAFRFACDWDAWERLSRGKGAFLYIPERLCGHRIHADSETTKQTAGEGRAREEYTMFRRFWPEWIARRLARGYAKGAESNQL